MQAVLIVLPIQLGDHGGFLKESGHVAVRGHNPWCDSSVMQKWVEDMSCYLKSVAPNHLVGKTLHAIKSDELLSRFDLNFNLRRYSPGQLVESRVEASCFSD